MVNPTLFESEFKDDDDLIAAADRDDRNIGQFTGRNRGPFVLRIKKALNAWASRQTPSPTALPVTDTFDGATSERVSLYKRSQTPPILNFAGKIDPVVGKKTVRALDKELPKAARGGGGPPIRIDVATDVVVRFAGTLGAVGEFPDARVIYPFFDEFGAAHGSSRRLVRLGRTTKSIGAEETFLVELGNRIAAEMRGGALAQATNGPKFVAGKICIYGSSSGGRNVIHLAKRLEEVHKLGVTYVGLADAAWFSNNPEVGGTPSEFGPSEPDIRVSGVTTPEKANRENFYQTLGQRVEIGISARRLLFTSGMDNKEIHGRILDWNNKKLDGEPALRTIKSTLLQSASTRDNALHVACAGIATGRIVARIKVVLEAGAAPPGPVPPVFGPR